MGNSKFFYNKAKKKTKRKKNIIDRVDKKFDIQQTSINECLSIVQNEYQLEKNIKQSLETRAGSLLTVAGTLCVFALGKVSLAEMIKVVNQPISFIMAVKILSCFIFYLAYLLLIVNLLKVIGVDKYSKFEVKNIDADFIISNKLESSIKIIITYRDIITQYREQNKLKANKFKWAILNLAIVLASMAIYINIL